MSRADKPLRGAGFGPSTADSRRTARDTRSSDSVPSVRATDDFPFCPPPRANSSGSHSLMAHSTGTGSRHGVDPSARRGPAHQGSLRTSLFEFRWTSRKERSTSAMPQVPELVPKPLFSMLSSGKSSERARWQRGIAGSRSLATYAEKVPMEDCKAGPLFHLESGVQDGSEILFAPGVRSTIQFPQ